MAASRADLRRSLRAARRALGAQEQEEASEAVAARLTDWLATRQPGVVAAYSSTDGEVSPQATVALLRERGWTIAYPQIQADVMTFAVVGDEAELVPAAFGLVEPPGGATKVASTELDVVLAPLVGFDPTRCRLGRGRAFYDRAFSFLNAGNRPRRPVLVGLAHDLQLVPSLVGEPHDVSLDAIVTPTRVHGQLPGDF